MDDTGEILHVIPLNDIFPHYTKMSCGCRPKLRPIEKDDGESCLLVIHNSWDRREVYERLRLLWPTYEGFPHEK